jgi:hypothetical protein
MRIQGRSHKSRARKAKEKLRELLSYIQDEGWVDCASCGRKDFVSREKVKEQGKKALECYNCGKFLFSKFREPVCLNPQCQSKDHLVSCDKDGDIVCSLCGWVCLNGLSDSDNPSFFETTSYRGYIRLNHVNERIAETTLRGPKIAPSHLQRIKNYTDRYAGPEHVIRGGRKYFTAVGNKLKFKHKKYGERWVFLRVYLGWEFHYEPLPEYIAQNIRQRFYWIEMAHNVVCKPKKHMINLNYVILHCLHFEGTEVYKKWGVYYADVKGNVDKLNKRWTKYINYINSIRFSDRFVLPFEWPLHQFSSIDILLLSFYN